MKAHSTKFEMRSKRSWAICAVATMIISMGIHGHDNDLNENLQHESGLKLTTAIIAAQSKDAWLTTSQHKESSLLELSKAEGSLPNPQVTVGLANLSVDSLDFNQEGMTQLRIGASQMFPRGETLALRQQKLAQTAAIQPLERLDRSAKVAVIVTDLWLDAYTAQESIKLIESKRELFEQLSQIAEANYTNAVGKVRQHNIIRAQLELTQLEDRLIELKRKRDKALEGLARWVGNAFIDQYKQGSLLLAPSTFIDNKNKELAIDTNQFLGNTLFRKVNSNLPIIKPIKAMMPIKGSSAENQIIFEQLQDHPAITKFDQQLVISNTDIELQKQRKKTQWGVSSAYGYRADAANGDNRSDLLSVGIMFDVPLFSTDAQTSAISAAKSEQEALKTAKWDFVREFIGQFRSVQSSLRRIEERQRLYRSVLLPQMHDQADASLSAYTNDDGEFSEVVRARIAELNGSIKALSIDTQKQKLMMKLNYFLLKHPDNLIEHVTQSGAN